jgi:succinate dehydrogenase/fumarate reductase flavoprotein subunit
VARWQREADVVVIGSGATGLPAAIAAREAGASVILVEAEADIGGHAIVSGGNVPLGGGTSVQKKYGIVDTADLVFKDLTDWSVVEPNGAADYRYNDREIIRAFADESAPTFEWLLAHGVAFNDKSPDQRGGGAIGNSVPREMHAVPLDVKLAQTGEAVPDDAKRNYSTGNGLMRPLEVAARKAGVEILLSHRMTALHRERSDAGKSSPAWPYPNGRVIGIEVEHRGEVFDIRARKGVIVATGGSTGNVEFRRMFDPRLTEEYCGLAGMPWSDQDASGELAAMAIGASLWGLANQTAEFGAVITKPGRIGSQWGYVNLGWTPGSAIFDKVRASGLRVADWHNVITVNMLGRRFYDETCKQFTANNYNTVKPYVHGHYLNAETVAYKPNNWLNAAMQGIGDGKNGGGPIWAIFDSDACAREKWDPNPPHVDYDAGFCFRADTIEDLAAKIQMKHQRLPMPPGNLSSTVTNYNTFVEDGIDSDFGKSKPKWKIAKAPFYAAWATPVVHDTRAGLRIDATCRVVDLKGQVIPGLYCGGESAGGFSLHGLARCLVQGVIAGREAAGEEI